MDRPFGFYLLFASLCFAHLYHWWDPSNEGLKSMKYGSHPYARNAGRAESLLLLFFFFFNPWHESLLFYIGQVANLSKRVGHIYFVILLDHTSSGAIMLRQWKKKKKSFALIKQHHQVDGFILKSQSLDWVFHLLAYVLRIFIIGGTHWIKDQKHWRKKMIEDGNESRSSGVINSLDFMVINM